MCSDVAVGAFILSIPFIVMAGLIGFQIGKQRGIKYGYAQGLRVADAWEKIARNNH